MKERRLHLAKGVNRREEIKSSLGKECEVEGFLSKRSRGAVVLSLGLT